MDRPAYSAYDKLDEEFVGWAFNGAWNRFYDQPAVMSLLPELAGKTVLDAGCGPGAYFEALLGAGARVVGADASERMIAHARARFGDAVELHRHDLEAPFSFLGSGTVDVVICALVIHYLNEPHGFLCEMRRVLRGTGRLVISTQHPTADWLRKGGSYFDRTLETDEWAAGGSTVAVKFWRVSLEALTESFHKAGFCVDRILEHQPDATFAALEPEAYEQLRRQPGFIAFSLRPAAG